MVRHWTGGVPADPTSASGAATWLVRTSSSATTVRARRTSTARISRIRGVWSAFPAPAQGKRTDWVTADVPWLDDAGIYDEMGQSLENFTTYRRGTTSRVSCSPIQRPRMGRSAPSRCATATRCGCLCPAGVIRVPGTSARRNGELRDVKDLVTLHQGDHAFPWSNDEKLLLSGLALERPPYRLVVGQRTAAGRPTPTPVTRSLSGGSRREPPTRTPCCP